MGESKINIVLDEKKYVEELLTQTILNKNVYYNINLIARYLYHNNGLNESQVYSELINIMETKYNNFIISKWQDTLLRISKNAKKKNIIYIDYVPITENELTIINNIESKPIRRVAFTLLCLSKYKNVINTNNNDWVNYEFKDIFKMSNVSTTIKEQCKIINELRNLNLIKTNNLVNNLSLNVCFVDKTNSKECLQIRDFRNLGYEYLLYTGEKFFRCVKCNILTRKRGTTDKYCKECACIVEKEKTNIRVKKHRTLKCNVS